MVIVKTMNKNIQKATISDLPSILDLQKTAFHPISVILDDPEIQPMTQTYDELLQELNEGIILKYIQNYQIVGSVRAYADNDNVCHIGKLIVHPDYHNRGIGKSLMLEIEKNFTACSKYQLFTGEITPNTLHLYTKLGFKEISRTCNSLCMIIMEKSNSASHLKH